MCYRAAKNVPVGLGRNHDFYGPPGGSQRAIMFLPCPSVIPSTGVNFLWGFEKVWGVFDVFGFCPCVRACVTLYVLSFVD